MKTNSQGLTLEQLHLAYPDVVPQASRDLLNKHVCWYGKVIKYCKQCGKKERVVE